MLYTTRVTRTPLKTPCLFYTVEKYCSTSQPPCSVERTVTDAHIVQGIAVLRSC